MEIPILDDFVLNDFLYYTTYIISLGMIGFVGAAFVHLIDKKTGVYHG